MHRHSLSLPRIRSHALLLVPVCAGLQSWANFFALCMAARETSECGVLFEQAINASHGELVGWWTRQTILLACKTMGGWEELSLILAPTRDEAEQDANKWCATVTDVLQALRKLQREFDYEDMRKGV